MKILKININNIQSLKGIQPEINFTDGVLAHAGLYAITGQTGAGKSTILDAVTLALYGKINRYGNDKPSSEIITHNQKEAYAEVTFEVNNIVYLARWAASFNKNNKINATDDRKLSRKENGEFKLIAEKVSNVNPMIEEIIGLKYEQFTKSILLAQNNFSAFLKAKPDERAEMLSKITGTQIYEEISKKVFEQAKSFESEINNLKATINGNILNQEELNAIAVSFEEKENTIKEIEPKLKKILDKITWLAAVENTKTEINNHKNSLELVTRHFVDNTELYQKLERFNKASLIEKDRQAFLNNQKECAKNAENTQRATNEIVDSNAKLAHIVPELESATKKLEETQKEQLFKKPLIESAKTTFEKMANTDEILKQNAKDLETTKINFNSNLEDLNAQKSKKSILETAIEESKKTIAQLEKYGSWETEKGVVTLKQLDIEKYEKEIESFNIESLQKRISEYDPENSGIEKVLQNAKIENAALKLEVELLESQKKESDTLENLSKLKDNAKTDIENWKKLSEYVPKLEIQKKQLEINSAELSTANLSKETLETVLLDKKKSLGILYENKNLKQLLASFEEHRQHLIEGEDCPLCGAKEHPYSLNLPEMFSKNDIDEKINELDLEIKSKENEKEEAVKKVASSNQQIINTSKNIFEIQEAITQLKAVLQIEKDLKMEDIQSAILHLETDSDFVQGQINKLSELNLTYDRIHKLYSDKTNELNEISSAHTAYQTAKKQIDEKKIGIAENFAFLKKVFLSFEEDLEKNDTATVAEIGKKLTEYSRKRNAENEILKANQTEIETVNNAITAFSTKESSLEESVLKHQKEDEALKAKKRLLENEFKNQTAHFELKSPQEEESRLALKVKTEQDLATKWKGEMEVVVASIKNKQADLVQLVAEKSQIDEALRLAATHLDYKLAENGFENSTQLQAALNLENSALLLTQKQQFENQKHQIEGALNAGFLKQAALNSNPLTVKSAEDLNAEKTALEEDKNKINQEIGQLTEQINNNKKIQEENQLILDAIQIKNNVFQKWDLLNKTIGSADGKSFKKFAQDFTLSLLVQHANKHLETMFNRYELFKDDSSDEMELQIKDNNFFGEIRNINSLSGGETFLVSLSLALGLSDLASKNTKIRSLFIDEGFGSLDPENLNKALDTLEMLRQNDDRQIGIISHVEELKKRITTQIQVKKYTAEFSNIEIVD